MAPMASPKLFARASSRLVRRTDENTTIGVVLIIVCVLVVIGVLAACIKGRTWGNALQNKARSNNEQRRSRKNEQGSTESAGPTPSQPANDAEGSAYHEFPAQTGDNDTVYNFVFGELQREKEASEERERAEAAAAAAAKT